MADVSENNANYYTSPYTYPLDNGKYTTLVGEFQNSSGAYGTFDQGGNLAEWDEGLRPSYGDGSRHLRGGSFYIDHGVDFLSSDGPWGSVMPNVSDLTFGFRVVQLPEPGAGVLACLSGLAILKKRRRAMGS
jgi:formylglycine-generating enzyme required for sulfatase activity